MGYHAHICYIDLSMYAVYIVQSCIYPQQDTHVDVWLVGRGATGKRSLTIYHGRNNIALLYSSNVVFWGGQNRAPKLIQDRFGHIPFLRKKLLARTNEHRQAHCLLYPVDDDRPIPAEEPTLAARYSVWSKRHCLPCASMSRSTCVPRGWESLNVSPTLRSLRWLIQERLSLPRCRHPCTQLPLHACARVSVSGGV